MRFRVARRPDSLVADATFRYDPRPKSVPFEMDADVEDARKEKDPRDLDPWRREVSIDASRGYDEPVSIF